MQVQPTVVRPFVDSSIPRFDVITWTRRGRFQPITGSAN